MNKPSETTVKEDKITMMSNSSTPVGALRTVSVHIKSGERKLRINALLDDASTKSDVTTNFIRTYFVSEQIAMQEANSVFRQFWEIDSSGTTTLPVMTKVEQLLLDRADKSVTFSENHYQIAIL